MIGKREQNRLEQRERILRAAFLLFSSRGFEETTVAQVATQAGVSRATVFTYFPSKRALVDELAGRVIAYYQEMLERALEQPEAPVPDLIQALFVHMADGLERFADFSRGIFREITKVRSGLDDGTVAQAASEEASDLLHELLVRGQERGELRRDFLVRDLIVWIDGIVNATIIDWLYRDSSEPLRLRMERAAGLLLGAIARDAEPSTLLPDVTPRRIRPPEPLEPLEDSDAH